MYIVKKLNKNDETLWRIYKGRAEKLKKIDER